MAAAVAGLFLVVVVALIAVPRGGGGGDPAPRNLDSPASVIEEGAPADVIISTSEGEFTITLDTVRAPRTANSFAYLAEEGFYDGLNFHRIVPGFVIQGGDPLGNGSGDAGYEIVEPPPRDIEYRLGTVAMAKGPTDPAGASGSQFFVVTGPGGASLPAQYALVGEVTAGLDVVEKIGRLGGPDESPTREVIIERADLERG